VEELKDAEKSILMYVQGQCFRQEVNSLLKTGKVCRTSAIARLCPMLSADGALCVGGRLTNATIAVEAKHQLILPGTHRVSQLIIVWLHQLNGHCGREHLLALLREKYWMTRARYVIRQTLKDCVLCKRRRAKPGWQKMADLPSDRVTPTSRPFEHTGVDYFGHFEVKRGRSVVKWYGCVFTCLTTRAIHIEVAHSLDVNSFIQALQRFIARRGKPSLIRSDNGTNFVGARNEMKVALDKWNQSTIDEFLKQRHVQWQFNPPAASHMGGVWERQVRTIRHILWALCREQAMDEEGLPTLMCMVESIVNSRPITAVSDDVADLEALTPNHLLLLGAGSVLPIDNFVQQDVYRRRWRQIQFLTDQFWARWLKQYLPSLQIRSKWHGMQRNLAVGDVVLVLDERSVRGDWPLGRIIATHAGNDGLVRSAEVRTKKTQLTRPVTKLCLLEGTMDDAHTMS
jgi:hypothetical protein